MNFHVLTLFPDMIRDGFQTSITGRAVEKGLLSLDTVNIRDFSVNKHNRVDDYPYGGGAGMVMQAEPVYLAYQSVAEKFPKKPKVLYMSPQGKVFNQRMAEELAQEEEIVFLCGHYEGIDERVLEEIVDEEVSIGDYVLTGGELPALVIMDAVSRLVGGVLHNEDSAEFDSFHDNLLEYPQYSRPEVWRDKAVPPILMSGHHANVEKWRREQSLIRTLERRPDLLENANLTKQDKKFLAKLKDTVKVYAKIKEGNRERIQVFEGTVLKKQGGSNRETFTVRKNSNGIGVEKTWPLHSPNVEKVEVVRHGKVRRAKLNYLRDRVGKAAKVKELVK